MGRKSSRYNIKENKTLDVEKKYKSKFTRKIINMKNSLIKLLFFFSIISGPFFYMQNSKAIVPYYFFPESKKLKTENVHFDMIWFSSKNPTFDTVSKSIGLG